MKLPRLRFAFGSACELSEDGTPSKRIEQSKDEYNTLHVRGRETLKLILSVKGSDPQSLISIFRNLQERLTNSISAPLMMKSNSVKCWETMTQRMTSDCRDNAIDESGKLMPRNAARGRLAEIGGIHEQG